MSGSRIPLRYVTAAALMALAGAGLMARLAWLQLGRHEDKRRMIANMQSYTCELVHLRGRVFDNSGRVLALDLPMKDVCVSPTSVVSQGHSRFVAHHLGRLLQLDPAMVMGIIHRDPDRQFAYVRRFVREDIARQIDALGMKGVFFEDTSQRNYPLGGLMAHVLGYANQQGAGSAGVEQRYNRYLAGTKGLVIGRKDGSKREVITERVVELEPQQGADVYLSLDQDLQYYVEQALDAGVASNQAKAAWAVVQEVRTGRILALACRPGFEPNRYNQADGESRRNRVIAYTYEPGSTFKVAVIAAALNEGVVTPSTVVDCENGHWLYQGRILHDYHPYGLLTVADVLKKSSNIGAAKVALLLGPKRLEEYLRTFGIGRRTGIDLPGEDAGLLAPATNWNALSISRIPMGHEVGVTSIQMINMLCAIANDGVRMRPTVVDRVVNEKGVTVVRREPEVLGRPIRPKTAALLRKLLTRATEPGGTGTLSRPEGFAVAGKTGSAQKLVEGRYSDTLHHASFMGFFPAEEPRIAIMVVVDEPQPLHTGGQVAAPIFRDIALQAARCLDIAPVPPERAYVFGPAIPNMDG